MYPARTGGGLMSIPSTARNAVSTELGSADPGYRVSGLEASNRPQRLRLGFTSHGVTVASARASLNVRLASFGRAGALRAVGPVAPVVRANRVSYPLGPVHEWYVNGPLGLEQGFDVASSPGGSGPLVLGLQVSGDLRASVLAGGTSALLSGGGASLRYGGLGGELDLGCRALRERWPGRR